MVVISFDKGVRAKQKKKSSNNPQKNEIHLLRCADKIDDILLEYILEHDVAAPEIAALLAHRLGNLLVAIPTLPRCESIDTKKLVEYVVEVLCRQVHMSANVKVS